MKIIVIIAIIIAIVVINKKEKIAKLEQFILYAEKSNTDESRRELRQMVDSMGLSDSKFMDIRLRLYQRLAHEEDAFAQYRLGLDAMLKRNKSDALYWFTKAAKNGSIEALCELGDGYSDFANDPKFSLVGFGYDPEKSFQYYLQAAKANNVNAMLHLASCYGAGEGVEANSEMQVYWLTKGISLKDWRCCKALADYYNSIINPNYNQGTALDLYRKSISFVKNREDFAEILKAMGHIYGDAYFWNSEETPLSDRRKAQFCFVMADLADPDVTNAEYARKTNRVLTQQEFEMLKKDVDSLRISF